MTLCELVKKTRIEKGVTQEFVAAGLGVSQSFLSMIESGERKPNAVQVLKIEEILDLPRGAIWNIDNIVMDRVVGRIGMLTPIELNRLDDYLGYLLYKRCKDEISG